ncbi:MAG: hypothetical protein Q8P82_00325 [bacterium]|nr:hypothetical protein [bacterium]
MKPFTLSIQTPDREWYHGPADTITLQTEQGEMQVHPTHAALGGVIHFSIVTVRHENREEQFLLRNGFIFIDQRNETVRLMGYHCEARASFDKQTIGEYMRVILEKLQKHEDLSAIQLRYLEEQKSSTEKLLEVIE